MEERIFNSIRYKVVKYVLNIESGRYEKQPSKIDFPRLPFDLKIEETREQRFVQQGASEIITGRVKNGKREFFTGLIPIEENFYSGDDYKKSKGVFKKSLCVFEVSNDFKTLEVFYFNNFYIQNPKGRITFIQSFVQSIMN